MFSVEASEPVQPLQQRAGIASWTLGAVIVAAAASFFTDLQKYNALSDEVAGRRVPLSDLQAIDDRVGTVGLIYGIALVLCVVTFLLWFARAYRNTGALGVRQLRYSPGWAVGSWLIPILSLFRPKQAMNDIWRGSDPERDPVISEPGKGAVSPLLHWWWAIWLLSNWVGTLAVRVSFDRANPTAAELKSATSGYLFADLADIVAGVLAILVIRAVTVRQQRRRAALGRLDEGLSAPGLVGPAQ